MNIVFDLDGTLIDSRPRLYRLFQQLAPLSHLTYREYWDFKRAKISNQTLLKQELGWRPAAITEFVDQWMELIESPSYLALDTNHVGMADTLAVLAESAKLHVCTARQKRQPVLDQLERLGLLHFFKNVLVTEQNSTKEALIAAHVKNLGQGDWMLGDTGKDIQVGKMLKIQTCAVLNGFLSLQSLLPYGPDRVLDTASQFVISDAK